MESHYLDRLFSPQAVAVIGASNHADTVGGVVFRNMVESGFKGALFPVNPAHDTIYGRPAYAAIDQIEASVDVAIICTKAETVPDIIEACGMRGVKFAIVLSAGFREVGKEGAEIESNVLAKAKAYGVRIVGPNCLGIINCSIGLNATFFKGQISSGNLALISQSGALCTAILDYAPAHDIGFSCVVSIGASADLDFDDILDYLANDPKTENILIYIEGIHKARNFMSALRAAARSKPVFVIKVGRHEAGLKAVMSHTGALVGADDVFDVALRRAGVVRVRSIGGLFSAAQTLASNRHFSGNRLAIVTNGGGPGVMAADRATDLGVAVANLSSHTLAKLNQVLPTNWSHNNPVDIIGDATAERYRQAVTLCLEDSEVDAVLVILTPQAMTQPLHVAQMLIKMAETITKPLLTCWMGFVQIIAARTAFAKADVPTFRTPEAAVEAFSYITDYFRNQRQLSHIPGPLAHMDLPDINAARKVIDAVLAENRKILTESESKAVLEAFRIPVANTVIARSADEALEIAEEMGFPVVMKINSKTITHKSDVGGVRLNLTNAAAITAAYKGIMSDVSKHRPDACIDGIGLEPMVIKPNGRELMLGVTTDPIFGPVITFGAGGVSVEILNDRAMALPPLNSSLVHELIGSTRVSKMLGVFRQMPSINIQALESALLRVSEMVCELPELKEMDINPFIVDENGGLAADARIIIEAVPALNYRYAHLAIYPYPTHLVTHFQASDGTAVTIRPIRPEDAMLVKNFFSQLSDDTKYFRFMNTVSHLSEAMLIRFTQIDYYREMALIAVAQQGDNEIEIGVGRYTINPNRESCEFALVVADAWQHKTIGRKLLAGLLSSAHEIGIKSMEGEVLANNSNMLQLGTKLGFDIIVRPEDQTVRKVVKVVG